MKKTLLIFAFAGMTISASSQISKETIAWQQPLDLNGKYLLKTNWDQWGVYARYTPENHVLGCWSTALAQILYYHQLKPHGSVDYLCSRGYRISDTLSKYSINWKDFETDITQSSSPGHIDAVARFSYLTAVAIRKDFGTSRYLEMVNPAPQLEKHFDCKAEFYGCFTGKSPFSEAQLMGIAQKESIRHLIEQDSVKIVIRHEIDQKRPVYFHMGNFTTYGHSTVIDGYLEKEGQFFVHINYGSSGFRSGWYDLFKPIDVEDDIKLRAFVTVRPAIKTN